MTNADRKTFKEARPYLVGAIALLFRLTKLAWSDENSFAAAEKFVTEFERRS